MSCVGSVYVIGPVNLLWFSGEVLSALWRWVSRLVCLSAPGRRHLHPGVGPLEIQDHSQYVLTLLFIAMFSIYIFVLCAFFVCV